MPEITTSSDILNFGFAEARAASEEAKEEKPDEAVAETPAEVVTEPVQETPAEPSKEATEDVVAPDSEAVVDSAEESESNDEIPELEAAVSKLSPEAKAIWDRQWNGVLKRETQVAAKEAELAQQDAGLQGLKQFAASFDDRDNAIKTTRLLAAKLADEYGISAAEVLGVRDNATFQEQDDWETMSWNDDNASNISGIEARVAQEVEKRLAPYVREIDEIKTQREANASQTQFKNFVDQVAPKIAKELKATDNGWQPSKDDIAEAIQAFGKLPQFEKDLAGAVRAYHHKSYAKHLATVTASRAQRGPEMIPSTKSTGALPPKVADLRNYGFAQARQERGF